MNFLAGELKIMVVEPLQSGPQHPALMRIKESEEGDGSCLWRMRCFDGGMRLQVKSILEGDVD